MHVKSPSDAEMVKLDVFENMQSIARVVWTASFSFRHSLFEEDCDESFAVREFSLIVFVQHPTESWYVEVLRKVVESVVAAALMIREE